MVANDDLSAPQIVLIDFGLAATFSGEGVSGGTPGYMPPETLETGTWYPKGDSWSMGVVIMQLLLGRVPQLESPPYVEGIFHTGVFEALEQGYDPMDLISQNTLELEPPFEQVACDQARDLLKKMLTRDRKARWKAVQCLDHPWFQEQGQGKPLSDDVVEALRAIGQQSEAQEAIVERLVDRMNLAECRDLNSAFEAADADHSGSLDADEASKLVQEMGFSEEEQQTILSGLLDAQSNSVSYKRFMEKMIGSKALQDTQSLRELFDDLDQDRSGSLDKQELRRLVHPDFMDLADDGTDVETILEQMDSDNNGVVSFDEFCRVALDAGRVQPGARRNW